MILVVLLLPGMPPRCPRVQLCEHTVLAFGSQERGWHEECSHILLGALSEPRLSRACAFWGLFSAASLLAEAALCC